jgi:hypothetical protein
MVQYLNFSLFNQHLLKNLVELKHLKSLIQSYNQELMICDSAKDCKQLLEEKKLLERLVERIKIRKYDSIKTPLRWG